MQIWWSWWTYDIYSVETQICFKRTLVVWKHPLILQAHEVPTEPTDDIAVKEAAGEIITAIMSKPGDHWIYRCGKWSPSRQWVSFQITSTLPLWLLDKTQTDIHIHKHHNHAYDNVGAGALPREFHLGATFILWFCQKLVRWHHEQHGGWWGLSRNLILLFIVASQKTCQKSQKSQKSLTVREKSGVRSPTYVDSPKR